MILVELKCFHEQKVFDMNIDENAKVSEIIGEISSYVAINPEKSRLVSVNRKMLLRKNMTINEQGVFGGDTLILV